MKTPEKLQEFFYGLKIKVLHFRTIGFSVKFWDLPMVFYS